MEKAVEVLGVAHAQNAYILCGPGKFASAKLKSTQAEQT